MFTGIIEELGRIASVKKVGGGKHFAISAGVSVPELSVDDSVAINGVCLTVIEKTDGAFTVEAVEETLSKTTLGRLEAETSVNLELPMKLNERLGGHLVLGHVDGVGVVHSIEKRESSWLFDIKIPDQFSRYVIPVGSIAFDGVSLTVAELEGNSVRVSIIPHTFFNTTFQYLKVEDLVNVECDIIGKFIERLMAFEPAKSSITKEKLKSWGYNV